MFRKIRIKFRIYRLELQGSRLGLQLLGMESEIQDLHPESLERELLQQEANILEQLILENSEELYQAHQELEQLY